MIPKELCPNSGQGCRIREGSGTTTLAFFQPTYNEHGVNINPDTNTTTIPLSCDICGKKFTATYKQGNRIVTLDASNVEESE